MMMMWTIFGPALLSAGRAALLMIPMIGMVTAAVAEQTETEQYDYVTPRDLGTEPYREEEL